MIYFLQRQNGDIKIGYTSDYYNRLASLKSEHGELKFLAGEDGLVEREQELHKRFAAMRYSLKQEWFAPNDTLMEYIYGLSPYEPEVIKYFAVTVSATTKEVINKVAATVQLQTGVTITADLAIRIALEKAFPEFAKSVGMDTDKEIQERKK